MIHCVAEMAIVGRQSRSEEDVTPEYHIPQSTYHNKVAYLGIEFFLCTNFDYPPNCGILLQQLKLT